jgi:hypothetical protein
MPVERDEEVLRLWKNMPCWKMSERSYLRWEVVARTVEEEEEEGAGDGGSDEDMKDESEGE